MQPLERGWAQSQLASCYKRAGIQAAPWACLGTSACTPLSTWSPKLSTYRRRAQPLRVPRGQRGERCNAPVGANDLPFLLPFCFPSPRTRLKSPLGEPCSCCQATRLPGSGDLINGDSVMQVAIATCRTAGWTGNKHMHVCKCMWVRARPDRTPSALNGGRSRFLFWLQFSLVLLPLSVVNALIFYFDLCNFALPLHSEQCYS